MIRLEGIEKSFPNREKPALSEVSLEIKDGEFVAIMGTSGCGKTTLLNIIGCMDRPTKGSYWYDETEVTELSGSAFNRFRKEKVSFVFQNYALIPKYTVFDNVALPLLIRNMPAKERKKRVESILSDLGIENLSGVNPKKLSGGEQQRVAIARACVVENTVILADEPTGALDKENSRRIMELFTRLNDKGRTILLVTHDHEVASFAHRIIRMDDGCLLRQES